MSKEIENLLEELRKNEVTEIKAEEIVDNKKLLVKDLFSITSYKEVCEILGEMEESCSYKKIKQIERLFNGGWKKDWSDSSQKKWYPYFNLEAGSLVFGRSHCHSYCFDGQVAYFKDEKTSTFVGKTFIDIYEVLAK